MADAREQSTATPSAEEVEQDIQRTREEMAETVDALVAKVDVRSRARQAAGDAKARLVDEDGRPRTPALVAAASLAAAAVVLGIVWWQRR